MECAPNNSIIITIAIKMHGTVFDLTLDPETAKIFQNTRLFSKAGDFEPHIERHAENIMPLKNRVFKKMNDLFIKDLNRPSLVSVEQYIKETKPTYQKYLMEQELLDDVQREKVCSLFGNITLDKIFRNATEEPSGLLESCIEYVLPQITGIYLISIHQKKNENNYELIYGDRPEERNLDLSRIENLRRLSGFFSRPMPNIEMDNTSDYPMKIPYILKMEEIKKDNTMSEEEKERKMEEVIRELYEMRKRWSLTVENGVITSIKMSKLVDIIKQICGENCYINLLDFSCNALSAHIPKEETYNAKYFEEWDIEKGEKRNWGGTKKRRKKRKKSISKRRSKKLLKKRKQSKKQKTE
jgi:uncharacterized protein YxjI